MLNLRKYNILNCVNEFHFYIFLYFCVTASSAGTINKNHNEKKFGITGTETCQKDC